MITARQLQRYEWELASIDGTTARQRWLLGLINRHTSSGFSAINLTDGAGRVLGGAAFPMSPRRIRQLVRYAPMLNAVLIASPLHTKIWSNGPNRAYACPLPLFRSSPEYRQVYRHMGMHHMAFFLYPPARDRHVLLGISSDRRPFNAGQLRALERICRRFSRDLVDVSPAGAAYPRHSAPTDHVVDLDGELRPGAISEYLHAMLAYFYGPLPVGNDGRLDLPALLVAELKRHLRLHAGAIMPLEAGFTFALNRRRQGRALATMVHWQNGRCRLSCCEDFSQLDYLKRVREVCRALRRDRFAVLSACLAIMDGARGEREVLRQACLSALKAASGRRIVSRARRIVESA